jgi:DNA-binding GntR family transcriptional regulator
LGACRKSVCLERQISIADQFCLHSYFYVDADRYPIFIESSQAELEGVNLKELIPIKTPFKHIAQRLRLVQPTARIAKLIGLSSGGWALFMRATIYGAGRKVLYVHDITMPPTAVDLWIDAPY